MALGKTQAYSRIHMIFAIVLIPIEYLIVAIGCPAYHIGVAFILCSFGKVVLQFNTVSRCLNTSIKRLLPIHNMVRIAFVSSLATILPLLVAYFYNELNEWLLMTITVFLFICCYYTICWLTKISYRDVLGNIINKYPITEKIIP